MHIVSHRAPLVRRVWRVRFLSGGAARHSDAWMLMHLVRRPVLPALGRLPVQMTIRASRGEGQKICIFDFICAFDATPNKGRAGRERQREREATKPVPLITSASSYLGECFGFAPQLAIMAPLYPSVLCCRDEEEWWDRPRLRTRQWGVVGIEGNTKKVHHKAHCTKCITLVVVVAAAAVFAILSVHWPIAGWLVGETTPCPNWCASGDTHSCSLSHTHTHTHTHDLGQPWRVHPNAISPWAAQARRACSSTRWAHAFNATSGTPIIRHCPWG